MKCRCCRKELNHVFVDLVNSPPSNSYLNEEQLNAAEMYFPLKIYVCDKCWLVQVDEYKKSNEIFDENYAYFSSMSKSWLKHSEQYVDMIINRLGLNESSQVIEVASNDGYLLQYFKKKNIPCLGIEPTASTADMSLIKGIETVKEFFSLDLARQLVKKGKKANLILGNNVIAHVPNINDFVAGLKTVLKGGGTITMEFPHLLNIIKYKQFDTIYHEHFSYLSLHSVITIFKEQNLKIYDVDQLSTHGGSLRIYATHSENKNFKVTCNVDNILKKEKDFGLLSLNTFTSFQKNTDNVKYDFLEFLIEKKKQGKYVVGYGAAAKGNTLLNYCGIKKDLIKFVADAAPSKQGKYLPGSHIPVVQENLLKEEKPDYVIIFPWNIRKEIVEQLSYIRDWNGQFVVAVPELEVF